MWNDTDIPLAYLISFRTYGTWLHGDKRGSTDRFQNTYKTPHLPASERWIQYNERRLISAPVVLNSAQRRSVDAAVRDTCEHRRWYLHAHNVRTNHVHCVVSIGETKPGRALNALKANATRQMRADGNWPGARSPWADKGSERYLWSERSVALAIDYVNNRQGGDLPDFD
jgi:REP element-mobilizing transposase RayT